MRITKWLPIVLVVLFLLIQSLFSYFGAGMCGLGMSNSWTCEWATTLTTFAFVIGILGLTLSYNLSKNRYRYIGLFFILFSLTFPYVVLYGYDHFPKEFVQKYYLGVTPQACEKGKPIVPWGRIPEGACKRLGFQNQNICDAQPESNKYRCYETLAADMNDITLCDKAYNESATRSRARECMENFAFKNNDPKICIEALKYTPSWSKPNNNSANVCISMVAVRLKDKKICEMILPGNYPWNKSVCIQKVDDYIAGKSI